MNAWGLESLLRSLVTKNSNNLQLLKCQIMLMNDALKYAANKAINCAKDVGDGKENKGANVANFDTFQT